MQGTSGRAPERRGQSEGSRASKRRKQGHELRTTISEAQPAGQGLVKLYNPITGSTTTEQRPATANGGICEHKRLQLPDPHTGPNDRHASNLAAAGHAAATPSSATDPCVKAAVRPPSPMQHLVEQRSQPQQQYNILQRQQQQEQQQQVQNQQAAQGLQHEQWQPIGQQAQQGQAQLQQPLLPELLTQQTAQGGVPQSYQQGHWQTLGPQWQQKHQLPQQLSQQQQQSAACLQQESQQLLQGQQHLQQTVTENANGSSILAGQSAGTVGLEQPTAAVTDFNTLLVSLQPINGASCQARLVQPVSVDSVDLTDLLDSPLPVKDPQLQKLNTAAGNGLNGTAATAFRVANARPEDVIVLDSDSKDYAMPGNLEQLESLAVAAPASNTLGQTAAGTVSKVQAEDLQPGVKQKPLQMAQHSEQLNVAKPAGQALSSIPAQYAFVWPAAAAVGPAVAAATATTAVGGTQAAGRASGSTETALQGGTEAAATAATESAAAPPTQTASAVPSNAVAAQANVEAGAAARSAATTAVATTAAAATATKPVTFQPASKVAADKGQAEAIIGIAIAEMQETAVAEAGAAGLPGDMSPRTAAAIRAALADALAEPRLRRAVRRKSGNASFWQNKSAAAGTAVSEAKTSAQASARLKRGSRVSGVKRSSADGQREVAFGSQTAGDVDSPPGALIKMFSWPAALPASNGKDGADSEPADCNAATAGIPARLLQHCQSAPMEQLIAAHTAEQARVPLAAPTPAEQMDAAAVHGAAATGESLNAPAVQGAPEVTAAQAAATAGGSTVEAIAAAADAAHQVDPQAEHVQRYPNTNTMPLTGCVPDGGLPIQQPGELRVLGQTMHPLVALRYLQICQEFWDWISARHRAAMAAATRGRRSAAASAASTEALLAQHVFIDPAGCSELGITCNRVIEQVAGMINDVLQAEYGPTASLLTDKRLPKELPVRFMEPYTMPQDYPIELLRGQRSARATGDLPAGMVLGTYSGYALFELQYRELMTSGKPRQFTINEQEPQPFESGLWALQVESYAVQDTELTVPEEQDVPNQPVQQAKRGRGSGRPPKANKQQREELVLYVSAFGYGNATACVNDPTLYPLDKNLSHGSAANYKRRQLVVPEGPNVVLRVVWVRDWPHLFMITSRPVKKHEDFWYDYSRDYWKIIWELLTGLKVTAKASYAQSFEAAALLCQGKGQEAARIMRLQQQLCQHQSQAASESEASAARLTAAAPPAEVSSAADPALPAQASNEPLQGANKACDVHSSKDGASARSGDIAAAPAATAGAGDLFAVGRGLHRHGSGVLYNASTQRQADAPAAKPGKEVSQAPSRRLGSCRHKSSSRHRSRSKHGPGSRNHSHRGHRSRSRESRPPSAKEQHSRQQWPSQQQLSQGRNRHKSRSRESRPPSAKEQHSRQQWPSQQQLSQGRNRHRSRSRESKPPSTREQHSRQQWPSQQQFSQGKNRHRSRSSRDVGHRGRYFGAETDRRTGRACGDKRDGSHDMQAAGYRNGRGSDRTRSPGRAGAGKAGRPSSAATAPGPAPMRSPSIAGCTTYGPPSYEQRQQQQPARQDSSPNRHRSGSPVRSRRSRSLGWCSEIRNPARLHSGRHGPASPPGGECGPPPGQYGCMPGCGWSLACPDWEPDHKAWPAEYRPGPAVTAAVGGWPGPSGHRLELADGRLGPLEYKPGSPGYMPDSPGYRPGSQGYRPVLPGHKSVSCKLGYRSPRHTGLPVQEPGLGHVSHVSPARCSPGAQYVQLGIAAMQDEDSGSGNGRQAKQGTGDGVASTTATATPPSPPQPPLPAANSIGHQQVQQQQPAQAGGHAGLIAAPNSAVANGLTGHQKAQQLRQHLLQQGNGSASHVVNGLTRPAEMQHQMQQQQASVATALLGASVSPAAAARPAVAGTAMPGNPPPLMPIVQPPEHPPGFIPNGVLVFTDDSEEEEQQ